MKHYLCLFAVFFALLIFSCGEVSGGFDLGGGEGYDAKCNGTFYKSAEQFCFNNEIYSLCGGKEYDIANEFCHSDGSVNLRCNGSMYNPGNDFCFDSKVYPKCGTEIYNPKELFCYENVLDTLCNGLEFNPKSSFCSSEDYKVHPFCKGERYNPKQEICSENEIYKVCPSGNFSKTLSSCCSASNSNCTEYKLCEDIKFNVASEFCYEGKIYELCGGKPYENPSNKFCSDGEAFELCRVQTGVDDFGRPQYDYLEYNPKTQKCGNNGLEDRFLPPQCPNLLSTQFCCFGKAYAKAGDNFCYKDELYPICITNTQLPTSDPAYRPRPTYEKNDTIQYNPVNEGCFEGRLYPQCSVDSIVGNCVDKTVKRCKQLGIGMDHVIDPLPEMKCNPNGSITGILKDGGYKVAQIGNQIWLAENLKEDFVSIQSQQGQRWTDSLKQALIAISPVWPSKTLRAYLNSHSNTTLTFTSNSTCYGNAPAKCEKYGMLYDWALGMAIDGSYNYDNYNFQYDLVSGLCPTGFYLPSDKHWKELIDYAGGAAIAGGRLKSTTGWNANGNGLDAYGFNALPGGSYNEIFAGTVGDGFEETEGKISKWWSVTQHPKPDAYYWAIYSSDTEVRNFFQPKASNKAYVRCVLYYKGL